VERDDLDLWRETEKALEGVEDDDETTFTNKTMLGKPKESFTYLVIKPWKTCYIFHIYGK
jgi:hypothetical protein